MPEGEWKLGLRVDAGLPNEETGYVNQIRKVLEFSPTRRDSGGCDIHGTTPSGYPGRWRHDLFIYLKRRE